MFADDTKIFRSMQSEDDHKHLQDDLTLLEEWTNKWLLKFHPDKCKVLTIGNKSPRDRTYTLTTKIDNITVPHKLEHSNEEKDLGITIDDHLTFELHICNKVNKANQMMGLIRRTFTYLDKKNVCPDIQSNC